MFSPFGDEYRCGWVPVFKSSEAFSLQRVAPAGCRRCHEVENPPGDLVCPHPPHGYRGPRARGLGLPRPADPHKQGRRAACHHPAATSTLCTGYWDAVDQHECTIQQRWIHALSTSDTWNVIIKKNNNCFALLTKSNYHLSTSICIDI